MDMADPSKWKLHADALASAGVVRLDRFVPPATIRALRDQMWRELAPHGIDRDSSWLGEARYLCGAVRPHLRTRDLSFDITALRSALDEWARAAFPREQWTTCDMCSAHANFPRPLGAGETAESWRIPMYSSENGGGVDWHVDAPSLAGAEHSRPPLIKAFVLLNDVAPYGGATLVVTGSHRLLRQLAVETPQPEGATRPGGGPAGGRDDSEVARRALADACARSGSEWCTKLFNGCEADTVARSERCSIGVTVRGVALRVAALAGKAGDVYLMDPRAVHSWSGNSSNEPRLAIALYLERGAGYD